MLYINKALRQNRTLSLSFICVNLVILDNIHNLPFHKRGKISQLSYVVHWSWIYLLLFLPLIQLSGLFWIIIYVQKNVTLILFFKMVSIRYIVKHKNGIEKRDFL